MNGMTAGQRTRNPPLLFNRRPGYAGAPLLDYDVVSHTPITRPMNAPDITPGLLLLLGFLVSAGLMGAALLFQCVGRNERSELRRTAKGGAIADPGIAETPDRITMPYLTDQALRR